MSGVIAKKARMNGRRVIVMETRGGTWLESCEQRDGEWIKLYAGREYETAWDVWGIEEEYKTQDELFLEIL